MADSKVENVDLINTVDKNIVLQDSTTPIKKIENVEQQDICYKDQSQVNDSNEKKLVGTEKVTEHKSNVDTSLKEDSVKSKNAVPENEKHPKEGTVKEKLSETSTKEKTIEIDSAVSKAKEDKNTISVEEETLNEILKVVHENLNSEEGQESEEDSKNLEEEDKCDAGSKENVDESVKEESVKETVNDKVNVEETEKVASRRDSGAKQSEEHMEVGIVGPPTTVTELINEEELRAETALSSDTNVQDHVAEWVQNSAKADELVVEEEASIDDGQQEKKNIREKRTRKKKNNDALALPTRKSQRIVSNIIKKSIKW